MADPPSRRRPAAAAGLAFLTAGVTLFVQVLVHRMVSAKLLNNYAFLVISLTMLGFAFSGVLLTRWLPTLLAKLEDAMTVCAALFALCLLGSAALFYQAPATLSLGVSRGDFVIAFLKSVPLALLFALPFTLCGLILGTLLSAPTLPTRRIYFFDLLGSAAGAAGVIPAIRHLGVERSALAASAALLAGTLMLFPPRGVRSRALALVAAIAIAGGWVGRDRVFDLRYPEGTMLSELSQLPPPFGIEQVVWDPLARIELTRIPPPSVTGHNYPALIGGNSRFHERFHRLLTQNNYAFTYAVHYDGRRESLEGIEQTIYAAAYQARSVEQPKVAIIGVGGGFDVLTALYFGARQVTAVEINSAIVDILTRSHHDYFRDWVDDPRVDLVVAEGRHYLATTDERFDVLQLSGVDSYSGTAAAVHVFSESYLYTEEAFDLYLERLTDRGVLNVMRLEFSPPREMLRALITAVDALRRAGAARPADHIVMLTQSNGAFTALLVKKSPFTSAEVERLSQWADSTPFFVISAAPGQDPLNGNHYQRFLALQNPRLEARFVASAPFDIRPVDDDRPFFFRYSFWWHVLDGNPVLGTPVMEYSIVLLSGLIGAAAILAVYLPLRYLAGRGRRSPGSLRYGIYFAGAGLGYMAIEIALLQRFGLFLGHPNLALSVVLAVLLFSSGLGSLFSADLVRALGGVRFVSYSLCGWVLLQYLFVLPHLHRLVGLAFPVRVALAGALILPAGLCLGVFVPTALEQLKPTAPAYVPWAWGINGIFSVLAPVLSVGFSMSWGNGALLLASLPVYLAVGWVLPKAQPAASA